MFSWINKKLEYRIFFYFAVVMILFSILMVYYSYYSTKKRYETETMKLYSVHGSSMISNLSDNGNVMMGLLADNKEMLKAEIEKILKDETIGYVMVYDKKLTPLAYGPDPGFESKELPPPPSPQKDSKVATAKIVSKKGEPFLDFHALVMSGDEPQGSVRIGMSLAEFNRKLRRSWMEGLSLIGAVLVFGTIFIIASLRAIMPPVQRLAQAARRISQGDFDVRVKVTSQDQIGLLTETFNEMVETISNQTRQADNLISNITSAIRLLTDTTSNLTSIASEQSSGATEQATVVEEVVTTATEISSSSERITEAANTVNQEAQRTSESANQGSEFMSNSIKGMNRIREQVEKTTEQIMDLAQRAQMVTSIINMIEEISEQTNLLSLNAAIEAAGAGAAGARFSVVATEVRRLASRTLEATESVRSMVIDIQKSTTAMVVLAENQQKAVAGGVESIQKMGEYFQHIMDRVESTRQSASEIELITKQQSSATQQLANSIQEIEQVAKEVENGAKEIDSSMAELNDLSQRLKGLIGEGTRD